MKLFNHIEGVFKSKKNLIKEMISLVILETKLVKISIYPLIINLIALIVLLIAGWSIAIILFAILLQSIIGSFIVVLLILFLVNSSLFGYLFWSFNKKIAVLSFSHTRQALAKII